MLWASVGDDDLLGGDGADVLFGGLGDDALDGGAGADTAVFAEDYGDYTITLGEGSVTVTGPEGTDTLAGIETLRFQNGEVAVADLGQPPVVTAETASGDEDTAIALTIAVSVANPLETVETVTIAGVPKGASVSIVGGAGDDVVLEPDIDGNYAVGEDQLAGLAMTPPADFNGSLDLTVTATSSEGLSSSAQPLAVTVGAVNDAPELHGDGELALAAGDSATITNQDMQLTDVDDVAADLTYQILDGPDHGSLFLDGIELGADDIFTQDDIDGGMLSYSADAVEPFSHEWTEGTPTWSELEEQVAAGDVPPVNSNDFTVPVGAQSTVITFESEGADYQNTLGWYKIDADGEPGEAHIIWSNASAEGSGGHLDPGQSTATLDGLQPGESFGLFIVTDGAKEDKWLKDAEDDGLSLNFNADGDLVATDASGNVVNSISAAGDGSEGNVFHAFGDNPVDGLNHAMAGVDDNDNLRIGFEDLKGGGDNDFDDLVISVKYEGPSADETTEDSFTFTATDDDQSQMQDQDDGGGYTVSGNEATFNITIDTTGSG